MTNQETRNKAKGVAGWLEFYDLSVHSDVEVKHALHWIPIFAAW